MAAPGIVARARVEELLAGAWQRRVTRVIAGGGSGKTIALRRLTADRQAGWLALAPVDREVEGLSARVAEVPAIESHHSGGTGTPAIGAGDSATGFLSALCLQAPPHLHIVLSGRRLPALRLGLASGRGELLDVAAPDLAFTAEETAELLVMHLGPEAAPLAEQCWSLTTGWPAALKLIVDRQGRLERAGWNRELAELRLRRGQMWRGFASELIERVACALRRARQARRQPLPPRGR